MESVNRTWGLSLIALTIAIHAMCVMLMALVGIGIRARLETRRFGLRHLIPITIGIVGAVGLLLAVLHGIEARSNVGPGAAACMAGRDGAAPVDTLPTIA